MRQKCARYLDRRPQVRRCKPPVHNGGLFKVGSASFERFTIFPNRKFVSRRLYIFSVAREFPRHFIISWCHGCALLIGAKAPEAFSHR